MNGIAHIIPVPAHGYSTRGFETYPGGSVADIYTDDQWDALGKAQDVMGFSPDLLFFGSAHVTLVCWLCLGAS